jgi:hypothetical protein
MFKSRFADEEIEVSPMLLRDRLMLIGNDGYREYIAVSHIEETIIAAQETELGGISYKEGDFLGLVLDDEVVMDLEIEGFEIIFVSAETSENKETINTFDYSEELIETSEFWGTDL